MAIARNLSKLINILIVVGIIIVVAGILSLQYKNAKSALLLDEYGHSLAANLADNMSPYIKANDTISMQAAIRRVAERSRVETIIIYDIKHTILAQFERSESLDLASLEHFTHQIIIGENLAGSVSVYMSQISIKGYFLPSLITLLLLLIAVLILSLSHKKIHQMESLSADTETLLQEIMPQDQVDGCIILITIANWDTLFQQLNAESRMVNLKQLEQMIDNVCELYKGQLLANTNHGFVVLINNNRKEDILHAFYSAQLILQCNRNHPNSTLQLKLAIQKVKNTAPFYKTLAATQKLFSKQQPAHELFIDKAITEAVDLSLYAHIDNNSDKDLAIVGAMTEHYRQLLTHQTHQLQQKNKTKN